MKKIVFAMFALLLVGAASAIPFNFNQGNAYSPQNFRFTTQPIGQVFQGPLFPLSVQAQNLNCDFVAPACNENGMCVRNNYNHQCTVDFTVDGGEARSARLKFWDQNGREIMNVMPIINSRRNPPRTYQENVLNTLNGRYSFPLGGNPIVQWSVEVCPQQGLCSQTPRQDLQIYTLTVV